MVDHLATARKIIEHYPQLARAEVAPMAGGLINHTFAVTAPSGAFILQRVNPIFSLEHHHNIEAVTRHLHARGLCTPLLVRTGGGELWVTANDGCGWRVLTRISGQSFASVQSPAQAYAAGAMVARFHSEVSDLQHTFVGTRSGVHDTQAHLATLRRALHEHDDHPLHGEVAQLASQIFAGFAEIPRPPDDLPQRIAHGDLKFSNLLFARDAPEQAVCLVDLDTLAPMPLHHELGDAWRSWCNNGDENRTEAVFDVANFEASARGYLDAITFALTEAERRALVIGPEWISLELTARFAADALNECYFGWDRSRYTRAGEHNLLRARGQLALCRSACACRRDRAALLLRAKTNG